MTAKRILMPVGDFVEDYEAMVPFQMLRMVGHEVHTVCPDKKPGDQDLLAVANGRNGLVRRGELAHDLDEARVEPQVFRGPATGNDQGIIAGGVDGREIGVDGKVVAGFLAVGLIALEVVHRRAYLVAAGVLQGKKATAYPALKPDIEGASGCWCEAGETFSNVYVDGNLVTAPAWPAHPEWIRKFLELLGTRIEP